MTRLSLTFQSELTVTMAFAGLLFGLLYFAALKRSIVLFVGGKAWLGPLALTLGRIGAAVAFLFFAAKLGAAPLLASLIGFLVARAVALRVERRAA